MPRYQLNPLQRFFQYVSFTDTCWVWTGTKNNNGYGYLEVEGKRWYAHRWIYSQLVDAIPSGMEIDHRCVVPACVRPDHLEPVTHQENMLRGPTNQAGINGRKTHCLRGHPYFGENLYVPPRGGRQCYTCIRLRESKRQRASRKGRK